MKPNRALTSLEVILNEINNKKISHTVHRILSRSNSLIARLKEYTSKDYEFYTNTLRILRLDIIKEADLRLYNLGNQLIYNYTMCCLSTIFKEAERWINQRIKS